MALDTPKPQGYERAWNGGVKPDVSELFEKLNKLYSPTDIPVWLHSPQKFLDGRVPLKLIETPEGYREVCDKLQAVLDGAYL